MGDVLWAANVFLAGDNSLQRQDANLSSKPIQHLGSFILVGEGFQAIDAIEKIHQCVVVESYNGASEDLSTEFFCDIKRFDSAKRDFCPQSRRSLRWCILTRIRKWASLFAWIGGNRAAVQAEFAGNAPQRPAFGMEFGNRGLFAHF